MKYKRVFLIVMDSLGAGEAKDASKYNDTGSNTILHISENYKLTIPTLQKLGYANLVKIKNVDSISNPIGKYGLLEELSVGKDTLTGHYEMCGLEVKEPYRTFTDTGFPAELVKELEERTGRKCVGNIAASGTEIIKELGLHHMKTGDLILYTSSDSVLQIAMHEDIIPIKEQYEICAIAREITKRPEYLLGRVIARPFIGTDPSNFKRTPNRHDYALHPFEETILNFLSEKKLDVIAVGKINDIFDSYGITKSVKTVSNEDGMDKTIDFAKSEFEGLCFVNLVDFDAMYGHRRDPIGYGKAIDSFDSKLERLIEVLKEDDLLILTADHGNDPVHAGTDHTRENVPLIVYSKSFTSGGRLKDGKTFANIGFSIASNFKTRLPKIGESFLEEL
jgi:phosphopentomutase